VIGGVLWIGAAGASPIVGLGVPSDAIIGGTVIDFESTPTDAMPVTFPSSTDDIDPRSTARTSISASGGVTIRGVDTLNSDAAAAIYVTPEIVRTQYDIASFVGSGGAIDRFNYLEYTGSETFNTTANFLTNWEKSDYQNRTFQETHANQFVFEFDEVVDEFAFNFGANDGDWVLAAYDSGGLLIEDLDIGVPAITEVSDGQYYGISAAGISYVTLTDTFVLSIEAGGNGTPCNPAIEANCGEWVMIDNLTDGRAVVPVPAALPLMLGGLGLLGVAARRRRAA
jgi:hypothetical protein